MKYYTCANTSGGFTDLTSENIFDVKKKILLKGESTHIKNLILKLAFEYNGQDCDCIIRQGTKDMLSGVVLKDKSLAITESCKEPDKIINLDNRFGTPEYNPKTKYLYECMYNSLADAKKIHDAWEGIYGRHIDFARLNRFGDSVIKSLVQTKSKEGSGKIYKRFFGTVTTKGPVNHIDDITADLKHRFFIKGRPGTGKSTFLKKLLGVLIEYGYDAEVYLCSFDRNSLDMVVSRELSFCAFDATPPHEMYPLSERDKILDFYEEASLSGFDEAHEKELVNIKSSYNMKIKEGMSFFKIAYELKEASDRQMVTRVRDSDLGELMREIHK